MKPLLFCAALMVASPSILTAQSDEILRLSTQYANLSPVEQMQDDMFAPASMAAQFSSNLPADVKLTEAQIQQIGTLLSGVMGTVRPQMKELMIQTSAELFSADELRALIAFYSSEHGASVMSKIQPMMLKVMAGLNPIMQEKMQSVRPEIVKIIQGN